MEISLGKTHNVILFPMPNVNVLLYVECAIRNLRLNAEFFQDGEKHGIHEGEEGKTDLFGRKKKNKVRCHVC